MRNNLESISSELAAKDLELTRKLEENTNLHSTVEQLREKCHSIQTQVTKFCNSLHNIVCLRRFYGLHLCALLINFADYACPILDMHPGAVMVVLSVKIMCVIGI